MTLKYFLQRKQRKAISKLVYKLASLGYAPRLVEMPITCEAQRKSPVMALQIDSAATGRRFWVYLEGSHPVSPMPNPTGLVLEELTALKEVGCTSNYFPSRNYTGKPHFHSLFQIA